MTKVLMENPNAFWLTGLLRAFSWGAPRTEHLLATSEKDHHPVRDDGPLSLELLAHQLVYAVVVLIVEAVGCKLDVQCRCGGH